MIENAVAFFEQYKTDETLRAKVQAAVDAYPGSLEIREALVEHALLPIARAGAGLHRGRAARL